MRLTINKSPYIKLAIKSASLGIAALTVLVTSNVSALEQGDQDQRKTQEDLKSKRQIEILVTASRGAEQESLDIPQAVNVVNRNILDVAAYTDIDDALRDLPNIGSAPAEGTPNYWQEGFTIRGLGGQRVLTLTDGVRQAGQGIGYGGGNLSLYDTFGVEKIEVLKGPASVLYGTDAFGGVVNVITRNPKRREEFGVNSGARYLFDGARDMNRAGAYLDFGDKNWATVFGGSYTRAEEPHLPDGVDPQSGRFRHFALWGKSDYYFDPDTKLRLIANIDRNSDVLVTDQTLSLPIANFPPPGSMLMTNSPLYFTFPTYQRSEIGLELVADNLDGAWDQVKTGVYWQQLYRKFHRETAFYPTFGPGFAGPPLFVDPTASVTQSVVDTSDKVNTFEWQTQARLNYVPHQVTFGLDLGFDTSRLPEVETQKIIAVAGQGFVNRPVTTRERVRAEADQYRAGFYVQDSYAMNKFEVLPGIRFDMYSVNDDQSSFDDTEYGVSGSLGTVWHQTDQQSVYLNLATGFRSPDLGERFQDGIVNLGAPTRIVGKADLDAERSYSAEWGIKRRDDKLESEMAIFANHINDYIGTNKLGVVSGFATEQYDNLGTVDLYGGELGGRYHLTERWSVFANAGRTWTKDDEKIDIRDWTFNYGAQYKQTIDSNLIKSIAAGLYAKSQVRSTDKTETGGTAKFEGAGYTTLDLKLNAELVKNSFGRGSLVAGVRNLLDKKYQEPFFALYQPERNVYVGVQFEY